MKNIKLSVIVPVYNVEKYIGNCLDSIIKQTYSNLEIICVNDGSTDNSSHILQEYAKQDSRIKIINRENGGLSAARNSGLAVATGDFVSFIDSDDGLTTTKAYEKIISCIEDNIDVVWFEPRIIYENYNLYQKWGASDSNWYTLKYNGKVYLTDEVLLRSDCNAWNKVIRLDKIREAGVSFPEGLLYEDAVFHYNLFSIVKNAYFLKEKLYLYHRRPGSIMSQSADRKPDKGIHHIYLLDKIYSYWNEKNIFKNRKGTFQKICAAYYHNAMNSVPDFEKSRVVWEMTKRLRQWNIGHEEDYILYLLAEGRYDIGFWWGPAPKPKLKGLKKIFCIRK